MCTELTEQDMAVIDELDAMARDGDSEIDHARADRLLLPLVHPDVRAAWERAYDRVGFWYA